MLLSFSSPSPSVNESDDFLLNFEKLKPDQSVKIIIFSNTNLFQCYVKIMVVWGYNISQRHSTWVTDNTMLIASVNIWFNTSTKFIILHRSCFHRPTKFSSWKGVHPSLHPNCHCNVFSNFVPNKIVTFADGVPPWMTE